MKNFVQPGDALDHTPSGVDLTSGQAFLLGALLAVATTDIADGATGAVAVRGVFNIPKAAQAFTQGAKLYWDDTNKVVTTTASGNTLCGVAAAAAASGDATGAVHINFSP